jgi:hypothetical protein
MTRSFSHIVILKTEAIEVVTNYCLIPSQYSLCPLLLASTELDNGSR